MKAIETQYNGYLFRSRLEARWAVFFDVMAISYEYEPEGFVLKDGTHYLPDFRVTTPQGRTIWYEIKATKDSDGIDKAKKFMSEFSTDDATQAYILIGDPIDVLSSPHSGLCPRCGHIGVVDYGILDFDSNYGFGCQPCDFETPSGGDNQAELSPWAKTYPHKGMLLIDHRSLAKHTARVKDAATKARSARFEHGQTPRK